MSRRAEDTNAKPNVYCSGLFVVLVIILVIVMLYDYVANMACKKEETDFDAREYFCCRDCIKKLSCFLDWAER